MLWGERSFILIAVKYWFFSFWIKQKTLKWIILSLLGLKVRSFWCCFGLSGCDKLNSPKSTNTVAEEQPTQISLSNKKNTSKPSRTLLTPGVYSILLLLSLGLFVIQNRGLTQRLYEGLNRLNDPDGRIVPGIAESWETKSTKPLDFNSYVKGFVGQMEIP